MMYGIKRGVIFLFLCPFLPGCGEDVRFVQTTSCPSALCSRTFEFEDLFGEVEGYGSSLTRMGPLAIEGVQLTPPAASPEVFSFAGGATTDPEFGLNESFTTDYIGVFTFDPGLGIDFPWPVVGLSFNTVYCACETQPSFDILQDDEVIGSFTTPPEPGQTALVEMDLPSQSQSLVIRNTGGSFSLLLLDDMTITFQCQEQ